MRPGAVARARDLLLASGLPAEDAEDVIVGLAQEAPDPARILPGGRDVLGEILDALAFETTVDLDAARAVLLEAWDEMHAESPRPSAATEPARAGAAEIDVGTAIAEFDRKRREGAPLEQAIRELERDLDLDPDEGGEDLEEEDDSAPDLPGVVAAIVEEFLWDEGREGDPERTARDQALRGLGQAAGHVMEFESLGTRELLDFAGRWSVEAGALRDPERAQALLDGLERFCRWAQENHDVPLETEFAPSLEALRRSLPRIAGANGACPTDPTAERGDWYVIAEVVGTDRAVLEDLSGRPTTVAIDRGILSRLRPGDLVRGRAGEGDAFEVNSCHPPELRELLGV